MKMEKLLKLPAESAWMVQYPIKKELHTAYKEKIKENGVTCKWNPSFIKVKSMNTVGPTA